MLSHQNGKWPCAMASRGLITVVDSCTRYQPMLQNIARGPPYPSRKTANCRMCTFTAVTDPGGEKENEL